MVLYKRAYFTDTGVKGIDSESILQLELADPVTPMLHIELIHFKRRNIFLSLFHRYRVRQQLIQEVSQWNLPHLYSILDWSTSQEGEVYFTDTGAKVSIYIEEISFQHGFIWTCPIYDRQWNGPPSRKEVWVYFTDTGAKGSIYRRDIFQHEFILTCPIYDWQWNGPLQKKEEFISLIQGPKVQNNSKSLSSMDSLPMELSSCFCCNIPIWTLTSRQIILSSCICEHIVAFSFWNQ